MIIKINKIIFTFFIMTLGINLFNRESVLANDVNINSSKDVKSDSIIGYGRIEAIDLEKHQLTIKHDPIKDLGWPAMAMAFMVDEKIDISQLNTGAIISFQLEKDDRNQMKIIHIEKNKD